MGKILELPPSRGTKLYRNSESTLSIEIGTKDYIDQIEILLIQGVDLSVQKLDLRNNRIRLHPLQEFLCANLSPVPITLELSKNTEKLEVIFNPYEFEHQRFPDIIPEEFLKEHLVPDGYHDILPKWYSIKFSYPKKNLIYIRPHLGISIQSHSKRTEDWKIIKGQPYIIANSKIYYSVNSGDIFHTDSGKLHGIINPTDEWVVIEETYTGTFEEEDITRVFNPNHYF